ncbi:hypothetical protein GOAMR_21_00175 [Gordonia amarae NBRC 15530]|uniref:DUF6924 domain-containing protein n=1 Tax=Gordonia amarae NBRC 15530 TaxID=1075090 RepID=G7GME2_9ACTN|nr:hypothetical protein GOAMR_21_00175 [Gordonia amarae NBRC 15530]
MTSWRRIRGLSYSTIGRTVRARVHTSNGGEHLVRFDPPALWRLESPDGTTQLVENETDEYRVRDDGVAVHAHKAPNRVVMMMGLNPMQLFTMYRWWPEPGPMARPRVGAASDPVATTVRGRSGWQVEFDDPQGAQPITVVIDQDLGVCLAWRQGGQWLEMSEPVLDEDFDPALFTWDGPTIEEEEHAEAQAQSQAQRDYEQQMRDLADMPQTQVGWFPTTIHTSAVDGDALTGALDITATTGSAQFAIRRWLTGLDEPEPGFSVQSYTVQGRRESGPWTVEVRTYAAALSPDDLERVFAQLSLPDPPGTIDDVAAAAADRRSEQEERETTELLGTGRELGDYLHADNYAALLIRTDFTDDQRWREVALAATASVDSGDEFPFQANLTCIDNPDNAGLTPEQLRARIGDDPPSFAFLADTVTMTDPEMPIIALDCGDPEYDEPGRTFRIIPSEMWGIENNLSIANMDFRDFADSAADDGVFRGFPPPPPHVATLQREELLALSATNHSTPALARFADDLPTIEHAYAVISEMPRMRLHTSIADLEPRSDEYILGDDDYLAATARDGVCHSGFVQIRGGHWSTPSRTANGWNDTLVC